MLAKAALIEMVETTREGKRPERTVYAITDEGRAVALERLRELLATLQPEYPTYCAALARRLPAVVMVATTGSDALAKPGVAA